MANGADDRLDEHNRRLIGRARGYESEECGECGHFTLVRNGSELKCDTCGTTTGGLKQKEGERK